MLDCLSIIQRYYTPGNDDYRVLVLHSRQVADLAVKLSQRLIDKGTPIDIEFVEEAAMLHDIGIFRCDAPSIHCHGTEPYIKHGPIGADILRQEGFPRHARVAERHTGTGLPGLEPETLEEQIVCYADKFYSKSQPDHVRTVLETAQSLEKFGHAGVEKFLAWAKIFE